MQPAEQTPIQWLVRFFTLNLQLKKEPPDLVLLGDSIFEGWAADPTWAQVSANRKIANLGIGYDRTQNVLWRLQNGQLSFGPVKGVALLIGTNNIANGHSPEETALGIGRVIAEIRARQPAARILLLGLLPRGERADDPLRAKAAEVNRLIAACQDEKAGIIFRDIGAAFLGKDGTIATAVMHDFLHPKGKGYEIMTAQLEPLLKRLLAGG
jgi:lysophospholipase L1-like esterase